MSFLSNSAPTPVPLNRTPHPAQANVFFLLNIMRVLFTKLRVTHSAQSNMYMKAVRGTLFLVPLLGIQFILVPWRPQGRLLNAVYEFIMNIFNHYQVPMSTLVSVCVRKSYESVSASFFSFQLMP